MTLKVERLKGGFHGLYRLKFNPHPAVELESPIIWYGLSVIEDFQFQKKVFEINGINTLLSNVYDLNFNDRKGIRKKLIGYFKTSDCVLKIDSGGFQLMKNSMKGNKKKINLTPESVYMTQYQTGGNIAVQLDKPLSPVDNEKEKYKDLETSLENYRKMLDINEKHGNPLYILPVIHGHKKEHIDFMIDGIKEISGRLPEFIGIGSLVPFVKTVKGTGRIGGKKKFIDNLVYIRRRLRGIMLHAFGVGGTMTYLAIYCGINSVDSAGWIQKSAYGVIQLPGIPDRFLTKKEHNRPYLIENRRYKHSKEDINEIELFLKCACPACYSFNRIKEKGLRFKRKILAFDEKSERGRLLRAIHNIYVFNNEINLIRGYIKRGRLRHIIEKRLRTSSHYSLFKYAADMVENRTLIGI